MAVWTKASERGIKDEYWMLLQATKAEWAPAIKVDDVEAYHWMAEHRKGEIADEIAGPQTGIPDPMQAETMQIISFRRGQWHMPDERILPWLLLLISARVNRQTVVTVPTIPAASSGWDRPLSGYISPRKAKPSVGIAFQDRQQQKLWEWAETTSKIVIPSAQLDENDGYWSPAGPRATYTQGHSARERYKAHRALYPLTGPEKINTLRIPRFNPFPRQRENTLAGHKFTELRHVCKNLCTCGLDWRLFKDWRPWETPFAFNPREEELFDEMWPALPIHLQRIMWVYRSMEPEKAVEKYKDWRSGRYYARCRAGWEWILTVANGRPWRVRYWENFFHSAKVRQIEDSPGDYVAESSIRARLFEHLEMIASPARDYVGICVDLSHTILRRQFREKKIPGYKLHDSATDVMAYLGCSRATAFRKIKAGFRIPVEKAN